MPGHSEIYSLRTDECHELADVCLINLDLDNYKSKIFKHDDGPLDKKRKILIARLKPSPNVLDSVTSQIRKSRAENPIASVPWDIGQLRAAEIEDRKLIDPTESIAGAFNDLSLGNSKESLADSSASNEEIPYHRNPLRHNSLTFSPLGDHTADDLFKTTNADQRLLTPLIPFFHQPIAPPRINAAAHNQNRTPRIIMAEEKLDNIIKAIKDGQDEKTETVFFEGNNEECIVDHINNFEKESLLNEWNDAKKIKRFARTLKNNARDYFMTEIVDVNDLPTWQTIKEKMLAKYKKDEDQWQLVVSLSKMAETDDPGLYATKIKKLCAKINAAMSQKAIVSNVVQGLLPSLRKEILHRNIKTFDELQENLEQIRINKLRFNDESNTEIINEIKSLREYFDKEKQPYQQNQRTYADATRGRQQQQQGPRNGNYNGRGKNSSRPYKRSNVTCTYCNIQGHHYNECRTRLYYCNICDKQGHTPQDCWFNGNQGQGRGYGRGQGRGYGRGQGRGYGRGYRRNNYQNSGQRALPSPAQSNPPQITYPDQQQQKNEE